MWTVLKWIIKLVIGFVLLVMHWSLFVLYILLLMAYNFWKQRRLEESRLGEDPEDNYFYREFELYDINGENADGTNRREIFEKCYRGDKVTLKYNPTPDDENRLEVWTKFGQIGLIAPYFVEQYADTFKSGREIHGRIKRIVSGANPSCTLEIAFDPPAGEAGGQDGEKSEK